MPILENRRIYQAGSSLAVTLPKGWLRFFGIEAGDFVEVVAGNEIIIRPINKGVMPSEETAREGSE